MKRVILKKDNFEQGKVRKMTVLNKKQLKRVILERNESDNKLKKQMKKGQF